MLLYVFWFGLAFMLCITVLSLSTRSLSLCDFYVPISVLCYSTWSAAQRITLCTSGRRSTSSINSPQPGEIGTATGRQLKVRVHTITCICIVGFMNGYWEAIKGQSSHYYLYLYCWLHEQLDVRLQIYVPQI
jgi:hypothetical protein